MPRIIEGVRDRILDAAQTIFERDGFSQTDMRSIAEAAGIAVGTLYNYYSNKSDLFSMVLYRMWQQTIERVETAAHEEGEPRVRLLKLQQALISSMDQSRGLGLRVIEALAAPDGVREQFNTERMEQARRKLVEAFLVPLKDWAGREGAGLHDRTLESLGRLTYAMAREIHEMPEPDRETALAMALTLVAGYMRTLSAGEDAAIRE